ncbi:MAG: beta-propeller fold lactonase family protein [Nitrosomonadales bacterium]|nr:beta-propeller fold lactonase family protein [Nitrosomonadales bacterium]
MQDKYKFLMIGALSASCLVIGAANAADKEVIPGWQNADHSPKDAPLHDPMILYSSGGVDGKLAVIGIPSFKTYRHIDCGVDTHEVVLGGLPAGNKNGTPDGKYAYLNDKGANTICEINLQTGFLERIIALPFPFGVHHIALSKDGKTLFGTGEYTGKMSKTDIATGKTEVIDWGPSPSAPDYIDAGKDGKYVFSNNYYHSTVGVFSTSPFKLVKEIPVGKNPHGTDVIPEGTMVLVSDKLSATMTVIDAEKLAVKKVIPTCAGPLHSVMDVYNKDGGSYRAGIDKPEGLTSKYAYESCFVADANVKIDLKKLEVVDEIPTHYRTGHISISADNSYVMALNKFSTGLFSPTGIIYPVNFEMWDAREKSPTYGKTLKIMPVDGEPHNAKSLMSYLIKDWTKGEAERGGLLKAGMTQLLDPAHRAKAKRYFIPKETTSPGIKVVDGVKEIHVKAFSYGYIPRQMRVNKGDKVRIFATNIDKAAGITKNPDVTMGLTIYGPYGLRTNMDLPRGVTAVHEFTADIAGEYEIFCTHFCGPLHLEMRATFFVDDPKKGNSNLLTGEYAEAQKLPGLVEEGQVTIAEQVKGL